MLENAIVLVILAAALYHLVRVWKGANNAGSGHCASCDSSSVCETHEPVTQEPPLVQIGKKPR